MKVLHILGSKGMGWTGGISATLNSLAQSRLANWMELRQTDPEQASTILADWRPDLLIWNRASSWRGIPELITRRGLRQILVEHHYSSGFEQHRVPCKWRFRAMLRLTYGLMDRVVAISAGQQQWLQIQALVDPNKLRLIRSSRTLDPFLQIPEKPNSEGCFTLGAYGRLTAQKGFDCLIQAVQQLPVGAVQLYIGGQGTEEVALKQLAKAHPYIHFLGRIDDIPQFLSDCDAVVIPSRWEPWGNVCLEARAAARPVLVTDVDGLAEQANACGLKVIPGNVDALAQGIRMLMRATPKQRQGWVKQGRMSASRAWEEYVDAWENLLEEFR
jgi:glycosyltransferase involved in cell wall biosynthesis